MKNKRKILILSPDLTDLGGTELETIITAKVFLENDLAGNIIVFSPNRASELLRSYYDENWILFQNYPSYFNNRWALRTDKYLKKLFKFFQHDYSPMQYLFWLFKSMFSKYDFIYVITSSTQAYYLPIIVNFNINRILVKFTYCFDFTNWSKPHLTILKKCRAVLVTAQSQKLFFRNKFHLANLQVIDVFIWNEKQLREIEVLKKEKFIFGMLCRIAVEKGIEDALQLIKNLNDAGYSVALTIKGPSYDAKYLEFLRGLIMRLDIKEYVILEAYAITPSQVPDFYRNINAFLITSTGEGGPNTGLECIAAGIPVLSYNIGAMLERLEPFKDLFIANDFEMLLEKAIFLLNLNDTEYKSLCKQLKYHYQQEYTNELKLSKTMRLLDRF